ncbi:MAG TPA: hypothetical protein VK179_12360 [Bacteroidales bacterium]|nr:hypothetical protein [Bacteroidales bacterium]
MKKPPVPVLLVAVLFIFAGIMGVVYHWRDFNDPQMGLNESLLAVAIRVLAVICGILLLLRFNWSRWLAVAWLLYHVILSAFHSTSELLVHIAFLIAVSLLLFLPSSGAYFRKKTL